jgi:hypothetical protein
VSPGNDKVVQLTAIASKAGTYTNRATVFTNNSAIANQTTTATVTVEEVGALLYSTEDCRHLTLQSS